ncbi:MAG: carbon-nitrogen hydrolase family protein [Promethearchaeota archaeon]
MSRDIIRVGACSLAAVPGDVETNLEKIKHWTERAAREKIDLLLFPELSLSGYWTCSELYYEAQPRDGEAVQDLIKFLGSLNEDIAISVGLAESYGGCIYNTQILLNRSGELYYYRKTHWPHAEVGIWSCGDRYPVYNFDGIKLGTAICYDNEFPEVHRIYALDGADLVLSPFAYGHKFSENDPNSQQDSIKRWKDGERPVLRAAAKCNYLWIVSVVGGGHVKDYIAEQNPGKGHEYYFPGVIFFIGPDGKVILESPDDEIKERLMWYDISRITNMELRKGTNNFFKNRRTATYKRICQQP